MLRTKPTKPKQDAVSDPGRRIGLHRGFRSAPWKSHRDNRPAHLINATSPTGAPCWQSQAGLASSLPHPCCASITWSWEECLVGLKPPSKSFLDGRGQGPL